MFENLHSIWGHTDMFIIRHKDIFATLYFMRIIAEDVLWLFVIRKVSLFKIAENPQKRVVKQKAKDAPIFIVSIDKTLEETKNATGPPKYEHVGDLV